MKLKFSTLTIAAIAVVHLLTAYGALAQLPTKEQLISLMPAAKELQGFVRFPDGSLIGDLTSKVPEGAPLVFVQGGSPSRTLIDRIFLDRDQPTLDTAIEKCSIIERGFYSSDGMLWIGMDLTVCTSAKSAKAAFIGHMGAAMQFNGRHASSEEIGTESSFIVSDIPFLNFYHEKISLRLVGGQSVVARRSQSTMQYPPESLDSIAYLVLLKAARQPDLTGVSSRPAKITVNDQLITVGNPIIMGKLVYVPAIEVAKKAGFAVTWDEPTGKLVITGKSGVTTLLAGYDKVKTANDIVVKLRIPVLKEGGLPIVSLIDFVDVLGGSVSYDGITYAVKF